AELGAAARELRADLRTGVLDVAERQQLSALWIGDAARDLPHGLTFGIEQLCADRELGRRALESHQTPIQPPSILERAHDVFTEGATFVERPRERLEAGFLGVVLLPEVGRETAASGAQACELEARLVHARSAERLRARCELAELGRELALGHQ